MSEVDDGIALDIQEAVIEEEREKQAPTTADPQLENTILSVALRSEWADAIASACLSDSDFTDGRVKAVWHAKTALRERGVDRNPVTLISELTATGRLKAAGGEDGVRAIYGETGNEKEIGSYCEQMRNFTIARSQAKAGRVLQSLSRKSMSAHERIDKTQDILRDILMASTGRSDVESAGAAIERIGINSFSDPTIECPRIPTGWANLDELIPGLATGNITIVGGRSGSGKSVFAFELAMKIAMVQKKKVLIFSLEMTTRDVLARMACNLAQIDNDHYSRGIMNTEEMSRFSDASQVISELPIYIVDDKGRTDTEVQQTLYSLIAAGNKPDLWILDHFQHMRPPETYRDARMGYSSLMNGLTDISKSTGIPGVILSQLTKEGKKSTERPKNADLREAGNIEDNAFMILFLHAPNLYKPGATASEKRLTELIVSKHRGGRCGIVEFDFYGEYYQFRERETNQTW